MEKPYTLQTAPFIVPTTDGKYIAEHFGLATDGNDRMSLAHMIAPPGWQEPEQTPAFDEITLVVKGQQELTIMGKRIVLKAGESIKVQKGHTVRYANPFKAPCEYIAICTPAFSEATAGRENASKEL